MKGVRKSKRGSGRARIGAAELQKRKPPIVDGDMSLSTVREAIEMAWTDATHLPEGPVKDYVCERLREATERLDVAITCAAERGVPWEREETPAPTDAPDLIAELARRLRKRQDAGIMYATIQALAEEMERLGTGGQS